MKAEADGGGGDEVVKDSYSNADLPTAVRGDSRGPRLLNYPV